MPANHPVHAEVFEFGFALGFKQQRLRLYWLFALSVVLVNVVCNYLIIPLSGITIFFVPILQTCLKTHQVLRF